MLITSFLFTKYRQFNGRGDALNGYKEEGRYYLAFGEEQYRETDRESWISTFIVQVIALTTFTLGIISFIFVIIPSIIIGGVRWIINIFRKMKREQV